MNFSDRTAQAILSGRHFLYFAISIEISNDEETRQYDEHVF